MKRLLPAWPGGASTTRDQGAGSMLASERPAASRAAVAVFGRPSQPVWEFALALVDVCRERGRTASVVIADADLRATEPMLAALRAASASRVTRVPDRVAVAGALAACPPGDPVVGVGAAFAEAGRWLLTVELGPALRIGDPRPGVDLALTRSSQAIAEQVGACLLDSLRGETGLSAR